MSRSSPSPWSGAKRKRVRRLGRWRNGGPPAAVQGPLVTPPPDLGLPAFVAGADRSLYFNLVSAFSHDVNLLHALLGIPGGIGSVRLHAAGRWSAWATGGSSS